MPKKIAFYAIVGVMLSLCGAAIYVSITRRADQVRQLSAALDDDLRGTIALTGDSTIRTKVLDALRGTPWPKEYSFRFLKNKLTDEWASRENEAFSAFGTLSEQYAEARARHDLRTEAVVCGEVVGLLKDRPTAESIVNSMVSQAEGLLRNGGTLDFRSQS